MRDYGLIAEEYITPERALMFEVVSNFSFNHALESHTITDASGQQSTVLIRWVTLRWVESGEAGFTAEQLACLTECRDAFNASHSDQIDFALVGNAAWAAAFNSPAVGA